MKKLATKMEVESHIKDSELIQKKHFGIVLKNMVFQLLNLQVKGNMEKVLALNVVII